MEMVASRPRAWNIQLLRVSEVAMSPREGDVGMQVRIGLVALAEPLSPFRLKQRPLELRKGKL